MASKDVYEGQTEWARPIQSPTTIDWTDHDQIRDNSDVKPILPYQVCMTVWKRYHTGFKGNCFCCDEVIDAHAWYCGHVISKVNGGSDGIDNFRPVCYNCKVDMYQTNMYEFICNHYGVIPMNGIKNIPIKHRVCRGQHCYIERLSYEKYKLSEDELVKYRAELKKSDLVKSVEYEYDHVQVNVVFPDGTTDLSKYIDPNTKLSTIIGWYNRTPGRVADIEEINGGKYVPIPGRTIGSFGRYYNRITVKYTDISDFPVLSIDEPGTEIAEEVVKKAAEKEKQVAENSKAAEEMAETETQVAEKIRDMLTLQLERLLHTHAGQIGDLDATLQHLNQYPNDIGKFIDIGTPEKPRFQGRWIKCDMCDQIFTHFISPLYHYNGTDMCPECYTGGDGYSPETVMVLWEDYNP